MLMVAVADPRDKRIMKTSQAACFMSVSPLGSSPYVRMRRRVKRKHAVREKARQAIFFPTETGNLAAGYKARSVELPSRIKRLLGACALVAAGCRPPGEAVTFDLITAFPATDSGGPTTEIRAGDQRAADSFVDGWSAPRRDADGGLVAWADAPTASISFDAGAHPLETTVTLDCVVGD